MSEATVESVNSTQLQQQNATGNEKNDVGGETADSKKKRTGPKRRKVTHGKKKGSFDDQH